MAKGARYFLITAAVLVAGGAAWIGQHRAMAGQTGAGSQPANKPAQPVAPSAPAQDALQRGAYVWAVAACADCHTPKDEKGQPIAGMLMAGHPENAPLPEWDPSMMKRNAVATIAPTLTAFAGPFGVSVAPNLTPDKETGLGKLTADDLIRSFRSAKHWTEGRPVLPPMPIHSYAAMTDDDIRALFAFLSSLPPVKNKAPASRPAPPPPGAK